MSCDAENSTFGCKADRTSMSATQIFLGISESVVNMVSIFVNMIIIVAVARCRRLHTFANMFIASLASCNLILSLSLYINLTIEFISTYTCLSRHSFECVYLYFISFAMTCSLSGHLMIAFERWLYIARPFLHQRVVTCTSTSCGVIFSWVLALIGGVNLISGPCYGKAHEINVKISFCLIFSIGHFSLSTFMFLIYGHISIITRNQTKNIKKTAMINLGNSTVQTNAMASNVMSAWKQIRMLVIVFGAYFLLMTPYVLMNIYVYIVDADLKIYQTNVGTAIALISHIQCASNFVTYSLQDRDFRHVLQQYCLKTGILQRDRKVRPLDTVT